MQNAAHIIDYPYQYLPPLDAETRENLKQSIKDQGVLVAIEQDECGNILDGHHRIILCQELGIREYPVVRRLGMSEEQKIRYTIDINENRRRPDENNKKFAALKLRSDGRSVREIAELVSASVGSVHNWVSGVQSLNTCEDEDERITGRDGKSYPASKPPRTITAHTQQQADTAVKILGETGVFDGGDSAVSADKIIDDANKTLYATNGNRLDNRLDNLMTSNDFEWYTPEYLIERVRSLLGGIDVDPCTSVEANATVQAAEFYTKVDDGLAQDWQGRVYLNPPYGDTIRDWVEKLCAGFESGAITQAVALVPARTDTVWFRLLRQHPRCFLHGRLQFSGPGDRGNSATFPSCVVALGIDAAELARAFEGIGDTYQITEVR